MSAPRPLGGSDPRPIPRPLGLPTPPLHPVRSETVASGGRDGQALHYGELILEMIQGASPVTPTPRSQLTGQSIGMSDETPDRDPKGTPEDLGHSIDRLFEGIEPFDVNRPDEVVLGDQPRAPSFPDSARDADLLDDVEIRPIDIGDVPDASAEMLKALEEEILREGRTKAMPVPVETPADIVSIIPVGASVTGGVDEIPNEEWSPSEAEERLEKAVRAYLASDDFERGSHYRRIAMLAWRLQEWGHLDPIVGAVERLAAGASKADQDPLLLARRLLTPPIARAMTQRLSESARDERRRLELIETMGRLGPEMATSLADALVDATERVIRRAYMDALVALGDDALPIVEDMTFDDRWFVVRNSMLVLREIAGERGIGHYTAALGHAHPRVRREALLALAHVGGDKAAMLVAGKIADPEKEVREAAAMAAGTLRTARAQRPLLEQLDREDDPGVEAAILVALGQIGDPGAVPAIEKRAVGSLLKKPPADVRLAAYRALASIGTPHARKLLKDAVGDKDARVREAAGRLVQEIESRAATAAPER